MRRFAALLVLCSLLLAGCAGGSSRYGCPAGEGYSCKSVSEVYAEAASGRKSGERPFPKALKNEKTAHPAAWRRFQKGGALRAGKNARGRAGERKEERKAARAEGAMPVYVPPPTIRLWIAPWQDARGVFHSGRYVYAVSGRGLWTIDGKTVPLGGRPEDYPEEIRLLEAGRGP